MLGVWWLASATIFASAGTVPSPGAVISGMLDDGWALYGPNVAITAETALQGFLWGTIFAVLTALIVTIIPALETLATSVSVISYCTPLLALGPLILVVFGGSTPSVFLAAISVYFTTMISSLNGLKSADPQSLELVSVYGGGRFAQLCRIRLVSSLPHLFAAMKIAAPAAVLGAILGEYLGGVDIGIGVSLTAAQSSFEIARAWGMAVAAGLLAGLGYALFAALQKLVLRYLFADGKATVSTSSPTNTSHRRPALTFLTQIFAAAAIVVVAWIGFLSLFPQVSGRVGRNPSDVAHYLSDSSARSVVMANLRVTALDSVIGFTAGMVAALLVACAFIVLPALRGTIMPVATLLRAIPLVALAPLIVLVFGRGVTTVAVLGGMVVFFPALVIIATGLAAAPRSALDVAFAYGAGRWTQLRMVSLPSAVPSVLVAARMSVPAALVGALIAEWLGTGEGLGSSMIKAIPAFDYDQLWASISAIIGVSVLAYGLVGTIEHAVARRMAG
ncbi:hypothetical protein A5788_07550 [Gordonia sp. 852002-50816_SCH5313054-c]|nr:hypothetical protein A5786_01990 [Gordonia sp. 852002-50816_SCH5313054-a]OBC19462.1 hypothetical protein A5788_07550 [Gordonia sp. 852002-50816_SCH5313054-c]